MSTPEYVKSYLNETNHHYKRVTDYIEYTEPTTDEDHRFYLIADAILAFVYEYTRWKLSERK